MNLRVIKLICLVAAVLCPALGLAQQIDLNKNSILVSKHIINKNYVLAEQIARQSIQFATNDTYFLRALDMSLIGQGRFKESEEVRDQIIQTWKKYEKPNWVAKGSPVSESTWERSTNFSKSYKVIGTEYFQPEVKGEKSLTTAFYKIIAFPTSAGNSPRLFKLEQSDQDSRIYILREKTNGNNQQVTNYGKEKPAFNIVVSDTIAYLDSKKQVATKSNDLQALSQRIQSLLLDSKFPEAEQLIVKGLKQAPNNLFFNSALDIVLNGQGRYEEAEQVRLGILKNWNENGKAKWIKSGSPIEESKWLRAVLSANSYQVWGAEYYQPRIKGLKFPITTFYLINAKPAGPGFRHRYFNLEMSKTDHEFFVLRESWKNGGQQVAVYGSRRPEFQKVMTDVIKYLNSGS